MKITSGSREIELRTPWDAELMALTGLPSITNGARARLLAAYEAGARAALREIENSRGARMEAALLEEGKT